MCIWATKRNQAGLTAREFIGNEIRRRRQDGKKLGSRFWADLFQAFDLNDSISDSLPEPDDDSIPSAELLDVLAAAHNENPVKACVTPLERYLEYCPPLSATPTYGILRAVQTGPTLPYYNAVKAQVAVLRFWARTSFVESEHPRTAPRPSNCG